MEIVVLANALQKEELLQATPDATTVVWITHASDFLTHSYADAFIDLQFINDANRTNLLNQLLPKPVVIDSVINVLADINTGFTRINAWNTFLSGEIVEASCVDKKTRPLVEAAFSIFNKKIEWLPDEPGFITARVISMIINEAYLSLQEGVSTKEDIDTAMKLGTNYPYGPFEWAEKIGLQNIVGLLTKLGQVQRRYKPAEFMVQETDKGI